jgi:hypothetical protein
MAQRFKCGFWETFDEAATRRYCKRVKEETIQKALDTDHNKTTACGRCRAYADAADAAVREAQLFRCGFTGPRWSVGDGSANDPHFKSCMEITQTGGLFGFVFADPADPEVIDPQTNARNKELAACKAKFAENFSKEEIEKCQDYADKAVSAAKSNIEKKCGASLPGRWSENREEHFMWCLPKIGDPDAKKIVAKEEAIREHGLEACAEGKKLDAEGRPPPKPFGKFHADGRGPSGGSNKSFSGKSSPSGQRGASMAKGDPAGSAGISTSRSVPSVVSRNPKTLESKAKASGGAYTSKNNPSGGSGGANRAMSPGLLDGDSGVAAAGAAGSGGAAGGSAAGGGGSAGGSGGIARTYSASPNMGSFAPRGGGLPAGSNSGTR